MEISLADLIDRYTILRLKLEHLDQGQKETELFLRREFSAYEKAIDEYRGKGMFVKQEWLDELYTINSSCWNLEAEIRQGKDGTLGLAEVGRRAILMRDTNARRIAVKNLVAQATDWESLDTKNSQSSPDNFV